jgi:hypothetical protein
MANSQVTPFSLNRLRRREKRFGYGSLAGALTAVLVVPGSLLLLFASRGTEVNPQGFLCCCVGPMVCIGVLVAVLFGEQFAPVFTDERLAFLLSSYGSTSDLILQIDRELSTDLALWKRGQAPTAFRGRFSRCTIVTLSWLLNFDQTDFWVLPLTDVLWAFKRVCAVSAWWGGERLVFQVCCVMGVNRIYCLTMPNESWAAGALGAMIERRPEMLVGYRGEWRDLAATGRKALRAEVQRRRIRWNQLDADERNQWLDERDDEADTFVRRVDPGAPDDGGVTIPEDREK